MLAEVRPDRPTSVRRASLSLPMRLRPSRRTRPETCQTSAYFSTGALEWDGEWSEGWPVGLHRRWDIGGKLTQCTCYPRGAPGEQLQGKSTPLDKCDAKACP